MLNLPNEANFLEWVLLWIGLVDKWLRDQVGQFVTRLRLFRIGFVRGYWSIWRGSRWGENGFVWGSFGLVADGRRVTNNFHTKPFKTAPRFGRFANLAV
jgi:hypothetical protein